MTAENGNCTPRFVLQFSNGFRILYLSQTKQIILMQLLKFNRDLSSLDVGNIQLLLNLPYSSKTTTSKVEIKDYSDKVSIQEYIVTDFVYLINQLIHPPTGTSVPSFFLKILTVCVYARQQTTFERCYYETIIQICCINFLLHGSVLRPVDHIYHSFIDHAVFCFPSKKKLFPKSLVK